MGMLACIFEKIVANWPVQRKKACFSGAFGHNAKLY
jgi:hypothetical protein